MRGIKAPKKPRVQRPLMDDRQDDGWCFVIPPTAATLAGFRAWTGSDDFPEHGHITFVGGEIIIDMSAERLGSHNAVRGAVSRVVSAVADDADLGTYYWEGARLVHMAADISNEPDGMLVRWESFASGAIRDVPSKDGEDFVELEGTPDWILEIVSPSSVHKDTVELRDRYHRARIREYWLIDVRGKKLDFTILIHHDDGYHPAPRKGGWQKSAVFGKQFRLRRFADRRGRPEYRLEMK